MAHFKLYTKKVAAQATQVTTRNNLQYKKLDIITFSSMIEQCRQGTYLKKNSSSSDRRDTLLFETHQRQRHNVVEVHKLATSDQRYSGHGTLSLSVAVDEEDNRQHSQDVHREVDHVPGLLEERLPLFVDFSPVSKDEGDQEDA